MAKRIKNIKYKKPRAICFFSEKRIAFQSEMWYNKIYDNTDSVQMQNGCFVREEILSMNRMQWAAVCTAVLSCACLMSGCTNISETESSAQTTVEMEVSQTETSVTASDADTETETETETKTEAALTDTASETQTSAVTTAAAGGDVVGNTGMTSAQWCKKAQQMFDSAASVYFTYHCTSDSFTYDESDTLGGGWYRVTSCDSIKAAEADYFAVFAPSVHSGDLADQFQEQDEKLYRCCGDRGADITYTSTEITEMTAGSDSSVSFTAVSTYTDPDSGEVTTQSNAFSLIYEDGAWLVGTFILPY